MNDLGYLLILWTMVTPGMPPTMQRFDTKAECEEMFQIMDHLQGLGSMRHECLPIADRN